MKAWKESASLILAATTGQTFSRAATPSTLNYDYHLLCLKRHQNSSFMPGSYVFPGGEIHPADSSLKWNSLFSSFGVDSQKLSTLIPTSEHTMRPSIFKKTTGELPREISLRITAIRETFEESGVLLCASAAPTSGWARFMKLPQDELEDWRSRVHNDAEEFYSLCEKLKCYPELWSLHEWSNWMTPTYFNTKRFNTIFYLACLPTKPYAVHESIEISDMKWDDPNGFLERDRKTMLPPPQEYEIARIGKFESVENLLNFAIERTTKGTQLYLPVAVILKDGKVHVYPGDSFYPENVSLAEKQVIDKSDITMKEFREISAVKHRMEIYSKSLSDRQLLIDNYEGADGHVVPMALKSVQMVS